MSAAIVIVDEDPSSLGATMSILGPLDASLRGFRDRPVALSVVRASRPAVLVVNATELGAADAIALARTVRTGMGGQSPRILLLAGPGVRRVDLTVVDDVLRRPWRATDLVERVRRLLRTSGVFQRPGLRGSRT